MEEVIKYIPVEQRGVLQELKQNGEDMLSGKLDLAEVDGKKFYMGTSAESVKYGRDQWKGIRGNDVFLASFPKTGTNWCFTVLWKIVTANDPKLYEIVQKIPVPLLGIELGPEAKFQILDTLPLPRRVIVTHLDGDDFPIRQATKKGAKIIYILRNPKDQTVSWFHYAQKIPGLHKYREQYPADWNKFTQYYFAGHHAFGVKPGDWYPEHILSWYKYKHQDNVNFVYYEDMKRDLEGEIKKMAEFLEVKLDNEQVIAITKACDFKTMKKDADDKSGGLNEARKALNVIRKGQVGDWKNHFTVTQSETIDKEFKEKFSHTDIKFTYQL